MRKKNNFSLAKAILAVLWHLKRSDLQMIKSHRYIKSICPEKSSVTYRSSIFRLIKANFVFKDDVLYCLTESGKKKASYCFIEAELTLHKPIREKWDGGWRIIFFDIPESQRKQRDYLRRIIKTVGFKEIQKSIWAYPYPVPKFLKEVIFDKPIKPYVRFAITNSLEKDDDMIEKFNL